MENLIDKITSNFYKLIFKEEVSSGTKIFIKNIWHVAIGFGFYIIFGFISQILAGRILGPAEYGKYALIQSIAMFLCISMDCGVNTALIKYNAEKEIFERQRKILSSSFLITFIFSSVSVLLFFVFADKLSKFFGVSSVFLLLAVFFALFYNLYNLAVSALRSLHQMKKFSISQAIYGFTTLGLLLVFIFYKFFSFKALVYTNYIASLIIFFLIIFSLRKFFLFKVEMFWIKKLMKYGAYSIIGGMAITFCLNYNKILINHYLTINDVGIYWAYYNSFVMSSFLFLSVFNTVFFPTVSRHSNKKSAFFKINKGMPYLVILGLPIIIVSGFVIFKLYGRLYPFDLNLGIAFAILSMVIIIDSIYRWLMNAVGKRGARIVSFAAIILAAVSIILNVLLIPKYGLFGAVLSIIIGYLVSIAVIISQKKYYKIEQMIV